MVGLIYLGERFRGRGFLFMYSVYYIHVLMTEIKE